MDDNNARSDSGDSQLEERLAEEEVTVDLTSENDARYARLPGVDDGLSDEEVAARWERAAERARLADEEITKDLVFAAERSDLARWDPNEQRLGPLPGNDDWSRLSDTAEGRAERERIRAAVHSWFDNLRDAQEEREDRITFKLALRHEPYDDSDSGATSTKSNNWPRLLQDSLTSKFEVPDGHVYRGWYSGPFGGYPVFGPPDGTPTFAVADIGVPTSEAITAYASGLNNYLDLISRESQSTHDGMTHQDQVESAERAVTPIGRRGVDSEVDASARKAADAARANLESLENEPLPGLDDNEPVDSVDGLPPELDDGPLPGLDDPPAESTEPDTLGSARDEPPTGPSDQPVPVDESSSSADPDDFLDALSTSAHKEGFGVEFPEATEGLRLWARQLSGAELGDAELEILRRWRSPAAEYVGEMKMDHENGAALRQRDQLFLTEYDRLSDREDWIRQEPSRRAQHERMAAVVVAAAGGPLSFFVRHKWQVIVAVGVLVAGIAGLVGFAALTGGDSTVDVSDQTQNVETQVAPSGDQSTTDQDRSSTESDPSRDQDQGSNDAIGDDQSSSAVDTNQDGVLDLGNFLSGTLFFGESESGVDIQVVGHEDQLGFSSFYQQLVQQIDGRPGLEGFLPSDNSTIFTMNQFTPRGLQFSAGPAEHLGGNIYEGRLLGIGDGYEEVTHVVLDCTGLPCEVHGVNYGAGNVNEGFLETAYDSDYVFRGGSIGELEQVYGKTARVADWSLPITGSVGPLDTIIATDDSGVLAAESGENDAGDWSIRFFTEEFDPAAQHSIQFNVAVRVDEFLYSLGATYPDGFFFGVEVAPDGSTEDHAGVATFGNDWLLIEFERVADSFDGVRWSLDVMTFVTEGDPNPSIAVFAPGGESEHAFGEAVP